jgi:hypothetical protein
LSESFLDRSNQDDINAIDIPNKSLTFHFLYQIISMAETKAGLFFRAE